MGQLKYGAVYKLWNPSSHLSFGESFRSAARVLFMCQRRKESPFSKLPDDCLFFILNMMRWDWVNDTSSEMRREQKQLRRLRRQQSIEEADAIMAEQNGETNAQEEAVDDDNDAENEEDDSDAENEDDEDFMHEDSSDDSEDADSSDDDSEESNESSDQEYAWGDHVGSRNAFQYDDASSDSDASSDHDREREERSRRIAIMRARRNILSYLRSH